MQIKQGAPQGVFYDNAPTQALVLLGSLLTFCSIEIFGTLLTSVQGAHRKP